jgi:phosphoribosyl 1,2-cyclic phosphodiesterase
MLAERNIPMERINAVFITHEHHDHTQGLRGLRKFQNVEFFANANTAEAIERKFDFKIQWKTFSTGDRMAFRDLSVTSFNVPHDAADPIGYVFSAVDGCGGRIRSVAWMTDLGYVPSHVAEYVSAVDLLIIESNYDNYLLQIDSKRPPYIKERIRSTHGHLSNEAAINFIKNNRSNRWKKIVFAHVSSDCNSETCIRKLLSELSGIDFEVEIAHQ